LVKTISSTFHKADSIGGGYFTIVDSFQYDNQNRVIKYAKIHYDTSFLYGINGNIIVRPNVATDLLIANYIGSNSIPSNFVFNGQLVTITADALGQIIKDSVSPTYISHYIYNTGLVVGQLGKIGPN